MTAATLRARRARARVIGRLRARLARRHSIRVQMAAAVAVAGLVGFATSAVLLALGFRSMAWRYPVAALVGYAAFVALLRVWFSPRRRRAHPQRERSGLGVDIGLDAPRMGGPSVDSAVEDLQAFEAGGGRFGGGGASGDWGAESTGDLDAASSSLAGADDEGALILLPVVLLLSCAAFAAYVVYMAPVFVAELVLDALLVSALYRRARRADGGRWMAAIVGRTWPLAVIAAAVLAAAGFAAAQVVPGADSIGDVVRQLQR